MTQQAPLKAHYVQSSAKDNFVYMTNSFTHMREPLFAQLAAATANDDELLALASHAQSGQPTAYLFLCAVQYLLIRNPDEPLARYFPSLESASRGDTSPENLFPVFREFALRRADEIRALIATRTLQTTTPDRGAGILLALHHVTKSETRPLNVVEIGCSAGLLMLFDKYRYDFGASQLGDQSSPVTIAPEVRGALPAGLHMPRIRSIMGIDLQHVDVDQPEAAQWLLALTFPTWTDSHRRLRTAIALRRQTPLHIFEGDALVLLPEVAGNTPDPLCVMHSNCLYQWPPALREQLEKQLCDLSRSRTLHRISIESAGPEFGEIVYMRYGDGALQHSQLLGRCDGYARWIEWLA